MKRDENEDQLTKKGAFICLACGSAKVGDGMLVSTDFDPEEPWSGVLQMITCGDCGREIPAHLRERWDGRSVDGARKEWQEVYREDGRSWYSKRISVRKDEGVL